MALDYTKYRQIICSLSPFQERITLKHCVISDTIFSLGGGTCFYNSIFNFKIIFLISHTVIYAYLPIQIIFIVILCNYLL